MGPLLDFLMLSLALGAGWLGLALLAVAGWRPTWRRATAQARSRAATVRPQLLDRDH